MSLRSLRTLGVVVVLTAVACIAAAGCSGADFSAGPSAGADGLAAGAGGVTLGGDGGRAGEDGNAGSANANAGRPGLGNSGSATGGALGVGDAGAAGQTGGTSGAGGGTGGSGVGDAGEGGAAGCAAVAWFPDGDGDGYGRSSGEVMACDPPTSGKWVRRGGDCDDDNSAVSPKEMDFEPSGYTSASSSTSFDYNCSGMEDPDPSQLGAAPDCASMLVLSCAGSGFVATARSGAGVNSLCGSTTIATCTKASLSCTAVVSMVAAGDGLRCR